MNMVLVRLEVDQMAFDLAAFLSQAFLKEDFRFGMYPLIAELADEDHVHVQLMYAARASRRVDVFHAQERAPFSDSFG
jgi:hypothetical protein